MAVTDPWQTAEIAGPKKASIINKPEVANAMIKRAKHPVLIIGHLAAEIDFDGRKMIDYLLDLAKTGNIPIIATGHTNRDLLKREYSSAHILPAVEIGHRLTDPTWNGMDKKGPYDLAIFVGLPYYMEWTILSGLKHFAPHLKTMTLDNTYQPHASWSFTNISVKDCLENIRFITDLRRTEKDV